MGGVVGRPAGKGLLCVPRGSVPVFTPVQLCASSFAHQALPISAALTPLFPAYPTLPQGRLTLVLGPPGAGKSVLLQTLAGQLRPSKKLRMQGDVRYNGQPGTAFDLRRTACYVDQV